MIFGVGKTPQPMKKIHLSCRVVPTNILGFSRVEQIVQNVRSRPKDQMNSDLIMNEGKGHYFDSPLDNRGLKRSNSMGGDDGQGDSAAKKHLKAKVRFSQAGLDTQKLEKTETTKTDMFED